MEEKSLDTMEVPEESVGFKRVKTTASGYTYRPVYGIMPYFEYEHLPDDLKVISKRVSDLANYMEKSLPTHAEVATGLRKLLEAKDCFVRAALADK